MWEPLSVGIALCRADGRTDRQSHMTKLIVAFCNLSKVPENLSLHRNEPGFLCDRPVNSADHHPGSLSLPMCFLIVWPTTIYTGCNRRNGPDFGRVFLMLNYTEKPQNTYIQNWTVSEIMASEFWNFDSCYTLTDYQIHIKTGRNMWFL